ncbi:hypothetical protein [Leisingera daeponensis]|uniref:hypothetical protein n=1 Tax=Leisingera daeponensis TaxID=405746 RepID=UPI001C98D4DF|nr:hypothetical protein [Leisingera daeponensis]MBY6056814.1 hypothetical protein [Leisingera daeponensis]
MEKQDIWLMVELVRNASTDVGLASLERLEQLADVATHSLEATQGEDGLVFEICLEIERPVDDLVRLARESFPADVFADFTIWRSTEDEGEEIARLYAEPLPGLM